MKRMRTAVAVAVLVCAAAAAPAQEADAETRFHRAYEQEVVDGKVADAAREYLAMMGDEKFPERLRQEAKFRFAVTAMLLGRADEARVHFGAIAADAKAPEALRARATEYLDAAKGVGVGNEIDKKMQNLVFDLAKSPPSTAEPPAYRDFEVIGKRSVPFLRQLLQHEDVALRTHAFRILLRMDEPGMADTWTPALTRDWLAAASFTGYINRHPADRAEFERRLLALDDEPLQSTLNEQSSLRPVYSAETLRAFAARKIPPSILLAYFPSKWTVETDRVRGEWIAGDDAKLSEEATLQYLAFVLGLQPGVAVRGDLFPAIVARLETMPVASMPKYGGTSTADVVTLGLSRLAVAVPPETLVDTLAKIVERGVAAPAGDSNPLQSGLVNALATAVERREPDTPLPARYGEILKTWFTEMSKRGQRIDPSWFGWHLSNAATRMPTDAATAFAVWAVTTPLQGAGPDVLAQAVPTQGARAVPIAMAAIRAAGPGVQVALLRQLAPKTTPTADWARELLRVLPEVIRLTTASAPSDTNPAPALAAFSKFAQTLPAEEAIDRFVEAAEAVSESPSSSMRGTALLTYLFGWSSNQDRSAYWTSVALPAFDRVWTKLAAEDRQNIVSNLLSMLNGSLGGTGLRTAIGKFVSGRYGDVASSAAYFLALAPELFPLTDWVPKVCPDTGASDDNARVPSERADPVVRELTADPATVNFAVLVFAHRSASPELRTEVFDRLLRTCPVERLILVSNFASRASPDALEDALRRAVAEKSPDLVVVMRLVLQLRAVRPSEALFPGVRLLLASEKTGLVTTGIETAKSLGREELLPALAGLLDSMDPAIRTAAKEAIDSIVALRKLKDEARRGAGGK